MFAGSLNVPTASDACVRANYVMMQLTDRPVLALIRVRDIVRTFGTSGPSGFISALQHLMPAACVDFSSLLGTLMEVTYCVQVI